MLVAPVALADVDKRTSDGFWLVMVTFTPPAGAAAPSVTPSVVCRSLPIVRLFTVIEGGCVTLTVADACVTPGADARNVVVPIATPVTVTVPEVWP